MKKAKKMAMLRSKLGFAYHPAMPMKGGHLMSKAKEEATEPVHNAKEEMMEMGEDYNKGKKKTTSSGKHNKRRGKK